MIKKIVSIITPVYNAERTLSVTLSALLQQTYCHLELLFVNDASTDGSLAVIEGALEGFKQRGICVEVLTHAVNQGVAVARNTGLDHATGDYIYYVDADDWLEADMIQIAVEEAERSHAQIIGFDWYLAFEKRARHMRQPHFSTPAEAIELMLNGKMRWNLWLFLVRRSLYEQHRIRFTPQMNMGEDMMVTFKLFSLADRVSYIGRPLYHYGQSNEGSLTKVYSDRHMKEVSCNVDEAARFLSQGTYGTYIKQQLDVLKLNIKLPLLISADYARYRKWRSWFPESNASSWDNRGQSRRLRLIQWAAWKRQFWIIKLHYFLVIKVVYGLIYN